jgi:hypothetical protein
MVSTDGSNVLVGTAVGAIYTTLHGYTLAPGQTWSFTLDVAATHAPQNTVIGFHLTTADNLGIFVPAATGGAGLLNPVSANFNGWYSPTFSATTANDANFLTNFDGKTPVLQIILAYYNGSPPTYPLYIDNIRGTTTATFNSSLVPSIPEPGCLALLVLTGAAVLSRRPC